MTESWWLPAEKPIQILKFIISSTAKKKKKNSRKSTKHVLNLHWNSKKKGRVLNATTTITSTTIQQNKQPKQNEYVIINASKI